MIVCDESNLVTITEADRHPLTRRWWWVLMSKEKSVEIRLTFANVGREVQNPTLLEECCQDARHQVSGCYSFDALRGPRVPFQLEFVRPIVLSLTLDAAWPDRADSSADGCYCFLWESEHA